MSGVGERPASAGAGGCLSGQPSGSPPHPCEEFLFVADFLSLLPPQRILAGFQHITELDLALCFLIPRAGTLIPYALHRNC